MHAFSLAAPNKRLACIRQVPFYLAPDCDSLTNEAHYVIWIYLTGR